MKVGDIFKDNFGSYKVLTGFEVKGKRKKMVTKPYGEYCLKNTMLNLEHISASQALERIMDICGIDQDDKFHIRSKINLFARPKR